MTPAEGASLRRPVMHMAVAGMAVDGRPDLIFPCIRSFLETSRNAAFSVRVTAIDNSPGSGLAGRLRKEFPDIAVVENTERLGYAANQNRALFRSDADYLLIANDDIEFRPGALARALDYLGDPANARVGIVGFQQLNTDGSLQPSTYSFPTIPRVWLEASGVRPWLPFGGWSTRLARALGRGAGRSRFWAHDRTVAVETFRGSLMLARASAVREVGPMDEVALVGGEETEWHRRFWNRGWQVVFLHDAPVVHHGSQTVKHVPGLQPEYLKGTLNYFRKHRSPAAFYGLCAVLAPTLAARTAIHRLAGRAEEAATCQECFGVVLAVFRSVRGV